MARPSNRAGLPTPPAVLLRFPEHRCWSESEQRYLLYFLTWKRIGRENYGWVSRSNYPALDVVQTSPTTMSFLVDRNYGQPTAHLRRFQLRLEGFSSAHAPLPAVN